MIAPHGGKLVDRQLLGKECSNDYEGTKSLMRVPLSPVNVSDVEMIGIGAFSPLKGFMGQADYKRVLREMRLANGLVWPIPITLPVDDELAHKISEGQKIALTHNSRVLAIMEVTEKFHYDKEVEASQVYQTTDLRHPGVTRLHQQGNTLLGGDIWTFDHIPETWQFPEIPRTPAEIRKNFAKKKWRYMVGFQTRNPLHSAHEYILENLLKIADGLLLHPLVGETKSDDISALARIDTYRLLVHCYYREGVLLGAFPAAMRYAGPREAVFHALCRKNYGCTHFFVGNNHAGVGNYYDPEAACEIFQSFKPGDEIGIEPLFSPEVKYHCDLCGKIVIPEECNHDQNNARLSGTHIREMLAQGQMPPKEIMRPVVSHILKAYSSRNNSQFCRAEAL